MKRYVYKLLVLLHFTLILSACIISTYNNYCDYNGIKKNNKAISLIKKVTGTDAVRLYGDISATQYGFGFFAPNVRSSGCISLENNQTIYYPKFYSREAKNRFSVFENQISDFLILQKETVEKNSDDIIYDSLKNKYYDLLYKSVSARLFNENKCPEKTAVIQYTIFQYPYFNGGKNIQPEAITIYEQQISLVNQ